MAERDVRAALVATARRMNALGINQGTSGNLSCRTERGLLITPSAVPYETLKPQQIVQLGSDGLVQGRGVPSTEWRFHRDILAARPEAQAVVHAHPSQATALACLRRDIPAFHYMVAVAGGDSIRCATYATFGSQALSDHALAALEGRTACLLANHGLIALGKSLDSALALAVEVEALAGQYLRALAVGEPHLLDSAQMAEVLEKFKSYGR